MKNNNDLLLDRDSIVMLTLFDARANGCLLLLLNKAKAVNRKTDLELRKRIYFIFWFWLEDHIELVGSPNVDYTQEPYMS